MRETTKTGKGHSVFLLPEVVAALRTHRKRQLEERMKYKGLWEDHNLAFPSSTGTSMSHNNLNRRHFKPLLKKANLPDIRPYDLRHTYATLWLESGEHPKIFKKSWVILGSPSHWTPTRMSRRICSGRQCKGSANGSPVPSTTPLWYG
jgi:integrase